MPSILLYCHTKEQIQEIKALIPDNLVPASKASLLHEASARFEKNSAQLFMKCVSSDIDEVRFDVVPELCIVQEQGVRVDNITKRIS